MKHLMKQLVWAALSIALFPASRPLWAADDPVFSGPQRGEKLPPLKVRGVFDDQAGKEIDFLPAGGKPVFLVFVHELTRPSVATTRLLMNYAAKRNKDVFGGVVFLMDDLTEGTNRLKRARHALPEGVPIGISPDGGEGPGAYGLNRNVTLTILIGEKGRVKANFSLVQPSVQADVPKVLRELVKVIGGEVPTLAELGYKPYRGRPKQDPRLATLLRAVIRRDASEKEVDAAAGKVEDYAAKHPAARRQIGEIARRIIGAGKLESYGTKRAQHYLKKWGKEFQPRE